jgi:hypothetical protein
VKDMEVNLLKVKRKRKKHGKRRLLWKIFIDL